MSKIVQTELEKSDDINEIKEIFQNTNLEHLSPELSKFVKVCRYLEDEQVVFKDITNVEEKTKEIGKIIVETRKERVKKNTEEIKLLDAESIKLSEERFFIENRDIIEQLYSDFDEARAELEASHEEHSNDIYNLESICSSKKELERKLESLESMSILSRVFKSKEIKELKLEIENLYSKQKKAESLENNSKTCVEEGEKELSRIEEKIRDVCGYRVTRDDIEQILDSGITLVELDRKIEENKTKSMELKAKCNKDMQDIEDIATLIGIKNIGVIEKDGEEQRQEPTDS